MYRAYLVAQASVPVYFVRVFFYSPFRKVEDPVSIGTENPVSIGTEGPAFIVEPEPLQIVIATASP